MWIRKAGLQICALAGSLAAVQAQDAIPTGVTASLDIAVLEQAKDVYFDKVIQLIENLSIPDFNQDDNHFLRDNKFTLNERTEDVSIYADAANNAIVLKCDKLSGVFSSGAFRYKETIFIAKGHLDVKINTIKVQFGLRAETTTVGEDQRMVPYIVSVDVDTDIDRFDVDIKLYGNIWTWFASAFEVFFVGTVADLIDDALKTGLQQGIPAMSNKTISESQGYIQFPVPNWVVDYETAAAATITDTYAGLGAKGMFFDSRVGEQDYGVLPPNLPIKDDTKPEKFQAFVSAYTLDSLTSSFLEVSKIEGWLLADYLPDSSPVQLTTTLLDLALPGIEDYYGADRPVDLFAKVKTLGNFEITEADSMLSGNTGINLEFWVHLDDGSKESAITIFADKTNFAFNVLVDSMKVAI